MKRKITLLLAAVLIFVLTGCTSAKDDECCTNGGDFALVPENVADKEIDTSFLGVTLTAKDVTPTGLTIVCTQSGGEPSGELSTGSYYYLEKYADGKWMPLAYTYDGSEGELTWTAEAWIINMEGTTEWSVNWEWLYGELSAGTYRIAKEIMDWRGVGDYNTYFCFAEFVIE